MNRRRFLKALLAAGAVTQLPRLADSPTPVPKQHIETMRRVQLMDYDCNTAICIQLDIDGGLPNGGQRVRQAAMFETETWESMTDAEREETWQWLRAKTFEFAREKGMVRS